MQESRSGGTEYTYGSRRSGEHLGQFIFANMPPEAVQAIGDKVVTPTVTELVRLAGIDVDGLPPLSIDDMIGPKTIAELDPQNQAFYFSGPNHPILQKARKLPTFVTYHNLLDVHGNLGITQSNTTKNFKGLVKNLFEDEDIPTSGEPKWWNIEQRDSTGIYRLHRFAIRRETALMAMRGEYRVGILGTEEANVFNGFGRSLIRALYDPTENTRHMELIAELEQMDELVVDEKNAHSFKWHETYSNQEGMSYIMDRDDTYAVRKYILDLLAEIGAIVSKDWWEYDNRAVVSEEGFAVSVKALCPLNEGHKKLIKRGETCTQGLHFRGLNDKVVSRAKSVANCIDEKKEDRKKSVEDELNLLDPDLQESKPKSNVATKDPEW